MQHQPQNPQNGPDGKPDLSRRRFVKTTAAGVAASAAGIGAWSALDSPIVTAAPKYPKKAGETLCQQLYYSFNEEQRRKLCFDFNHPLRSRVENNWHIVKPRIKQILNADQQDLVKQIFMSIHSEQYASEVYRQFMEDNRDFGTSAVAMFGKPAKAGSKEKSKFEFVFTGRHTTRRCDGDSVEGAAFGGPIFYGHASKSFNEGPKHEGNVYWFQAESANKVYAALSGKQQKIALRPRDRGESGTKTVKLKGTTKGLEGIPVSDLSKDQKKLVTKTLADLLMPFRKKDADEAIKLIEKAGGIDKCHMAFFKNRDIGKDGVWDVWQIEGPSMVWYFRGSPHVHTWVNIRDKA